MQKYLPEPFIFAIILTFAAILIAMPVCHQSIAEVVANWGGGVWNLLGFSMQMALVLVTGATLAAAPAIKKGINSLASLPKKLYGMGTHDSRIHQLALLESAKTSVL